MLFAAVAKVIPSLHIRYQHSRILFVKHPLFLLIIAAVALRLVVLMSPAASSASMADEREYMHLAGDLVEYGTYSLHGLKAFRAPGYPLFLAGSKVLFGGANHKVSVRVVKGIQSMLNILTGILLYLLARRLHINRRGALIAAGAFFLMPNILLFGFTLLTETLYIFLVVLFLFFMYRRHPKPAHILCAGLTAGVAALTRTEFLLTFGLIVLWHWRHFLIARRLHLALLVGGLGLIVGPWLLRNYIQLDRFPVLATNGGANFYIGNHPETRGTIYVARDPGVQAYAKLLEAKNEADADRELLYSGIRHIKQQGWANVERLASKFAYLWSTEVRGVNYVMREGRLRGIGKTEASIVSALFHLSFHGLFFLFMVHLLLAGYKKRLAGIYCHVIALTVTSLIFIAEGRFHMSALPLFLLAGAYTFYSPKNYGFIQTIKEKRTRLIVGLPIIIIFQGLLQFYVSSVDVLV